MSLAITYARAQVGIDAPLVSVETHVANGLPAFALVGLSEAAVRESRERVRAALLTSGYEMPPAVSRSTSRPPTCPRRAGASTSPWRSACWRPRGSFPPMSSGATSSSANWP